MATPRANPFGATLPFPPAIVLVGGLGTRLRRVLSDRPKPLAPVHVKPFLEWILRYLYGQGARDIALAAGCRGEQVEMFARTFRAEGLDLTVHREPSPLGTAGAIRHAVECRFATAPVVLVCNGDSLAAAPLQPLFAAFEDTCTDVAMLAVSVEDASHFGTLEVDASGRLRGFQEKRPGSGLINAGVYLLREPASLIPHTPGCCSLETEVFPKLLESGARIRVARCEGAFLDIGREETLAQADAFVERHGSWFA